MAARRYLIVNADDFGQSEAVTQGIIKAHEQGIVTSASLMVRWPGAVQAAEYARNHPQLSLGLHVDLGEWIYRNSGWSPVYEVIDLSKAQPVREEIDRQLETFRRLGLGEPTHLDSHQHVHQKEPTLSALLEAGRRLGVPVRHCSTVRYFGQFYGQTSKGQSNLEAISLEALLALLRGLPPGISELGCHPALGSNLDAVYSVERTQELQVLCDSRVRDLLAEEAIELRSFRDLPALISLDPR
jgi:predicted glycoside hydrolase/deacetylase ChbG (UPF0249 family)